MSINKDNLYASPIASVSSFKFDESVFRFVYRCDGSPVLASPITPFKGANDLSHFVALEMR